jgi:hypothetical protein
MVFSVQRVDFLSIMNGTPTYLTKPPKEHLVEKVSMVSFDIILVCHFPLKVVDVLP